ncbi:3-hydroxyacyl-ACP dehydratase FabZ [Carboxydothermus ferrireducens]|uniref:3-hydroxyacyl-[acyl-carrier-protein] dehydratase FabZ n=1 Tax=Carboxydothermus ferrireducens DSM 11255 TaxID=1119529 RepID=A0ABX2R918_9THEO|nr:3-hydroxyacyl-ACP dehydratase FabZ [Carboxydothermus ferrireducens]NYE57676.1 3-hydroxyacyl-[acyl-carrier-protein] dehydratase [Carboxydothermus ferrireducens DSM 11255]
MSEAIKDVTEIMNILPHRYPFLLVDKILEVVPGEKAVGIKNVTINEPFFQGHFPGRPIMPGVLLLEAMAQVGAVAILTDERYAGKLPMFAGIDGARFRKPVLPGDQVVFEVGLLKIKGSLGKARGSGKVNGELVVEAEILFALA